jgi:uncharacterized protein (TIGR02246 family)
MKAIAILCGTAALVFTMTACNQAPPAPPDTHDADVKAISDAEAEWSKATAANDIEKAIGYYADDAVLIAPGGDAVQGKQAIGAAMRAMSKDPAFSLHFQTSKAEVAKSGDVGYTWGVYQLTVTDSTTHKPINDHGSYATVYKKQADGAWKAEVDIASSALPPAPPMPAKHK